MSYYPGGSVVLFLSSCHRLPLVNWCFRHGAALSATAMRLTRTAALPLSGHILILLVFLFLVYYDAYLGRHSIHFKNILKIVTKIITKNLSKSYNKKFKKSVVDTYLLFKLDFRDDFRDNFHDIFKCIELHPRLRHVLHVPSRRTVRLPGRWFNRKKSWLEFWVLKLIEILFLFWDISKLPIYWTFS